jgi:hypothetical protein
MVLTGGRFVYASAIRLAAIKVIMSLSVSTPSAGAKHTAPHILACQACASSQPLYGFRHRHREIALFPEQLLPCWVVTARPSLVPLSCQG